jgi:ubiquinone/menaquinone biosynthesis C-methylase UbiE
MTDAIKPSKYAREFLARYKQYKLNPVLSLMCGNAEDAIFLAQNELSVSAVDNDSKKLAQVQLNPAIKNGNIRFICADILRPLPIAGHSFNPLYFKFGLHYFSEKQIRQMIIPEIVRLLNPGSLVNIVYRYIDSESTDKSRYEISEMNNETVVFTERSNRKNLIRYVHAESTVKKLFSDKFDVIKAATQKEESYNRFSNDNNSIIISLLLTLRP